MKNPSIFYKEQLKKHLLDVKRATKKLIQLSLIRLLVFSVAIVSAYLVFPKVKVIIVIGVLGLSLFLFLLKKYSKIKEGKLLSEALILINKEELKIASGNFYNRAEGVEFQDPKHFYSLDIDLFGIGSFYQFMNRTSVKEGSEKLASLLTENSIKEIPLKQEVLKELASIAKWRQNFSAIASLVTIETPANMIISWLQKYNAFLPKLMKWLPLVFSVISAVLLVLSFMNIISPFPVIIWMFVGLFITGKYLKNIAKLSSKTGKIKNTFKQYSVLLDAIENQTFNAKITKRKQQKITQDGKKASVIFNEFSKLLDALDNRNNILFAIVGNGFLLWDCKQSYKIEQWIKKYNHKVADWFEVISFFDAYNSLGNFVFNHPLYTFPKIVVGKTVIEAKKLGHPLLKTVKRVNNDLTIEHQQFFIVTGANMAGKSTFLRTLSLHIVMANTGLPVCAEKSMYSPIKLITSMRTSDSLSDNSSYFFSELTRLKLIVDAIQEEPYFIILDEILKGTNSTDKAIGSKKFVEKLVASNATGIIATHDLSLCKIANEIEVVKNYYFDAEIINDELYFDYTYKKGICKNMNASFLLRKMEII